MLMIEYKDIGWWYWLVTAWLLTFAVSGISIGFMLAIGLTIFQLIHFIIREQNYRAFPVQVRFWYLMLLIVALPQPLQWIFWIPTIGTWAQILFGYCTMARCVSLLAWNRKEKFTLALLRKTFFSRPVKGSIQQGFAAPVA
ncbi:MAG: hypothetical protein H8E21_05545 [Gammaproteobacteria bacterium]|nr:hypothetical protein [Gammaproteobacteria bacterium]MBL6999719.1 hypothetical protein [Gammaproteobacteria bacterium]